MEQGSQGRFWLFQRWAPQIPTTTIICDLFQRWGTVVFFIHVSIKVLNATMVVYGILFGGMHPRVIIHKQPIKQNIFYMISCRFFGVEFSVCSVCVCVHVHDASILSSVCSCLCNFVSFTNLTYLTLGAGCSSVDSVPAFEAVGRRIDPSQWTQLQFGLFSVPTRGPQLVYQRPWYVLFCLWKSAYKRSLAAYRKE